MAKTLRHARRRIQNHALMDTPRLLYMHFWANDEPPLKLAQALKAALDHRVRLKVGG